MKTESPSSFCGSSARSNARRLISIGNCFRGALRQRWPDRRDIQSEAWLEALLQRRLCNSPQRSRPTIAQLSRAKPRSELVRETAKLAKFQRLWRPGKQTPLRLSPRKRSGSAVFENHLPRQCTFYCALPRSTTRKLRNHQKSQLNGAGTAVDLTDFLACFATHPASQRTR